jgi:hypothetical protein
MTTNAIPFQGSKLQIGGAAIGAATYVDVLEIVDIQGVTQKLDTVDVSHSQSTFHEFISGLFDYGDVVVKANYLAGDTTGQDAVKTAFDAKIKQHWRILMATSPEEKYSFDGLVTGWATAGTVNGKWDLTLTLKVQTQPTL